MNIDVILAKIPLRTIDRLERYVRGGRASAEKYRISYEASIITACSVLFDTEVITMSEREFLSHYYRNRLYNGGNAQPSCDGNCQECEYAVWFTENLGESRIIGCKMGGNAR